MANYSAPSLNLQGQSHAKGPVSRPALPVGTAVAILAILLILLSWLHLILALETVAVGRQVQKAGEELSKVQRGIADARCELAEATAPGRMSERATMGGYAYQQPFFLLLPAVTSESTVDPGTQIGESEPPALTTTPPESPFVAAAGQLLARLGLGPSR